MATEFDDLWLTDETETTATDYFQTGGGRQYANLTWFNGYKVLIVDPATGEPIRQKGSTVKAVGFHLQQDGLDDDLVEALNVLVQQKKAQRYLIVHADGKRKWYYKLLGNRYYLLSHAIPAPSAIARDVTKQLGVACGTITTINEKDRKQNTSTFAGVLAVSSDLYEAGYVDSDGAPKPLVMRFKALVGRDFLTALRVHGDYIKFLREQKVDPKKAQYWAYACLLGPSEGTVSHGSGPNSTEVYAIVNLSDNKAEWGADDTLYVGSDLYRKLFGLLYEIVTGSDGKRKPIAGGPVIEWCQAEIERAAKNQRDHNPDNKMPFGNSPIPDWYYVRRQMDAAAVFNPAALNGQATDDSEASRLHELLVAHEKQAHRSGDEQWIDFVTRAGYALDEGELKTAQGLLNQAGERRLALRSPSNGATANTGFN